jgi:hypothetical protein
MMEYIEFFFCDFWHWLGLEIILATVFLTPFVLIVKDKKDNK